MSRTVNRERQAAEIYALCDNNADYAYDVVRAFPATPFPYDDRDGEIVRWLRANVLSTRDALEIQNHLEAY